MFVKFDEKQTEGRYLREQDERDPLVVCDVALHGAGLSGHGVGVGQVVGVGDPADAVGERHVAVGEVGGRPAVDRRADVLRGADDDREDDEEDDRVAVTQTVRQVVVVARVRLDDPRHRVEDALEHHRYRRADDLRLHTSRLTFRGVASGGISVYIPPQKNNNNQSTLQIFMWLLVVVFFSLTQDKLLLILKLE